MQVDMCASDDQPMTPYEGYLRIQTHTLVGECCVFYSGTSDCMRTFSPDVLKVGAWVIGLVSLYRYAFPGENRLVCVCFASFQSQGLTLSFQNYHIIASNLRVVDLDAVH
jgi:hypothetical protein